MRVEAEIDEVEIEDDDGLEVAGVCATCTRCGRATESFGTTGASVRRCLALLREECPYRESNFYFASGDERPPFED